MIRVVHRQRGVTLLEIVLAMGLMAPVMGTLLWFYSSALDSRDRSATKVREVQLARVITERIRQELWAATGFAGGYGTGIFGDRHSISINTVVIPDKALVERRGLGERQRPGQFDLRQVDYYIAWDELNLDDEGDPRALGLVRRERKTFNQLQPSQVPAELGDEIEPAEPTEEEADIVGPGRSFDEVFDEDFDDELAEEELEGAKRELYAPEIKFIEFFYHDGNRWWETWEISQGNSLPQMVMITIGYVPELPEDEEIEIIKDILEDEDDIEPVPEDRFVMIVRIPQSDTFFGSRVQREMSSFADLEDLE